eukprot:TRINITY_DN16642_c0_g1_i1.p1 TRINITY_DN16642_c0_g1~~TRINITY_DN16642_c0_g1_i1.p1  ORF type:complete len:450 (+),score=122.36 TRINITY_DN16642_c0_g1_i1:80-1429(+)
MMSEQTREYAVVVEHNRRLIQQVEEQGALLNDMARQLRVYRPPIKSANIDYSALQTVVESGEEEISTLSAKNEQLAHAVRMLSANLEDAKADLAEALADESFFRHPANMKLYRENEILKEELAQEKAKSDQLEQQLSIMAPSHKRIQDEPLISETVSSLLEKSRRELLWSEREQAKERQQHIASSRIIADDLKKACSEIANLIEMTTIRDPPEDTTAPDNTELMEFLTTPFKAESTTAVTDIIDSPDYLHQLSSCIENLLKENETLNVMTLKSESNRIIKKIESKDGISTATICKVIQMLGEGALAARQQFDQQEQEITESREMVELLEQEVSDSSETISMLEVELERVTTALWDENEKTGAERIASNAAELHSRLIEMEQENRMLKMFMSKLEIPAQMMASLGQVLPEAVDEMSQILQETGDPIVPEADSVPPPITVADELPLDTAPN